MFDPNELNKVIELHQKSYNLFIWLNNKLKDFRRKSKKNTLFDEVHDKVSFYKGSLAWINRHVGEFPPDARPARSDVEPFSHLFTSYLKTSFVVSDKVKVSDKGHRCWCPFCSIFFDITAFQLRNPDKKARANAQKLKARYIETLGRESELSSVPSNIEDWIPNNPKLNNDISLATYAQELIRRSKFVSQGEGILALWREIAWKGNRKDKKFKLSTKAIVDAESRILKKLRE
jgi:hypothetical protein